MANLSETGTTVTVSIGNGYETTTGLIENVNLKKGDKVVAGQLIGYSGKPKCILYRRGPWSVFQTYTIWRTNKPRHIFCGIDKISTHLISYNSFKSYIIYIRLTVGALYIFYVIGKSDRIPYYIKGTMCR